LFGLVDLGLLNGGILSGTLLLYAYVSFQSIFTALHKSQFIVYAKAKLYSPTGAVVGALPWSSDVAILLEAGAWKWRLGATG
jgi:hypothetical protein